MNTLRSFAFLCIIIALIIWGHPGSFIFLFAVVIVSLTTFLLNKRNHPYGLLEKFGIDIRFQSAVFLIIITIFSFWTASRYFYADDQIYKNVDHHALGLNGFQINDSQVMLVTNDSTALFDEEITPGKLNLCFQSDSHPASGRIDSAHYNTKVFPVLFMSVLPARRNIILAMQTICPRSIHSSR